MKLSEVSVGDEVVWWWVTDSPQTWKSEDATVIKVTAKRVRIRLKYPLGGENNKERVVDPGNLDPR